MKCYIYDPNSKAVLPPELNKSNTLYFPEKDMTTQQMFTTVPPTNYNIVTNHPFLIPIYSKPEVFIWKNGEWVNPDMQTYGASYDYIMKRLFGASCMPKSVLDGTKDNCMGRPLT